MSWIQTYSGQKFFISNPKPELVRVNDIARSLSMICRFAGHCREFYSVSQHSVYTTIWLQDFFERKNSRDFSSEQIRHIMLVGLLHDAAEAYIGDIPRPAKSVFSEAKSLEERILRAVFEALASDVPEDFLSTAWLYVKIADNALLGAEARDLFTYCIEDWHMNLGIAPADIDIVPCSSKDAEELFLQTYYQLLGAK